MVENRVDLTGLPPGQEVDRIADEDAVLRTFGDLGRPVVDFVFGFEEERTIPLRAVSRDHPT